MIKHIVLGTLVAVGYFFWTEREVTHGPGVIAPDIPKISRLTWEKPFKHKSYSVIPKRVFEGEVRILEKKRYFFDEKKDIAPFDFFVGWSKLSDERNLTGMNISISDRDAHIAFSSPPLPVNEVYRNTELVHFIASDKSVRDALSKAKKGDIIRFKGLLADISDHTGTHWETSISLSELGNKSDKIVWIDEFIIL